MSTKNRLNDSLIKPHYHVVPLVSEHIRSQTAKADLGLFGITVFHIGPECGADSYMECDCDLIAVRACIRRSENCCECDLAAEWCH